MTVNTGHRQLEIAETGRVEILLLSGFSDLARCFAELGADAGIVRGLQDVPAGGTGTIPFSDST